MLTCFKFPRRSRINTPVCTQDMMIYVLGVLYCPDCYYNVSFGYFPVDFINVSLASPTNIYIGLDSPCITQKYTVARPLSGTVYIAPRTVLVYTNPFLHSRIHVLLIFLFFLNKRQKLCHIFIRRKIKKQNKSKKKSCLHYEEGRKKGERKRKTPKQLEIIWGNSSTVHLYRFFFNQKGYVQRLL
jgi:hypothetical protein